MHKRILQNIQGYWSTSANSQAKKPRNGVSLFTHCRLNPPHFILVYSNFNFRYVRLCGLDMGKLFADSVDPDQTPYSAASDLGFHCFTQCRDLQITMVYVKLD